jgi:AraC-like DNA-binding protein
LSREDASLLDVSFSALNYVKSQKNQYAYMLEGYDDTWRYVGNKGLASFANLPSGTYRLRVKGANNDGVWNREGLALTIRITPVIWETMIFKAAILLTIVSLLLLAFFLYRKLARRQGEQPSLADLVFNNHTEGESVILSKNSEDHALIERIVTYVESNMTNDDLSIEAMCTELGMSRAKLFRKVKEITGQTVSNFIKDIRLEKARLYLDANPRSVSEVAYTIGFKSHAHFTRSFKEKFGKSPSAYVQAQ